MKERYNFTPETQKVLRQLKEVEKVQQYKSLPTTAAEGHKPIIKKAYITALRAELLILHSALEKWIEAGAEMEENGGGE